MKKLLLCIVFLVGCEQARTPDPETKINLEIFCEGQTAMNNINWHYDPCISYWLRKTAERK